MLRPFTVADADDLYDMQAEPHVVRFFDVTTREEIDEWLLGQEAIWSGGGYGRLVITDRVSGEFLGRSGLRHWAEYDEVEVAWMLRAVAMGRGYATEAGKACLDWGFANLSVDYITAMIRPENTESIAVAERLGMQPAAFGPAARRPDPGLRGPPADRISRGCVARQPSRNTPETNGGCTWSMPDPDEPLTVALLTDSTRPRGAVVHTLALAEALVAAGQDVTVWALGRGGDTGFFRPLDSRLQVRVIPVEDAADEPMTSRVARSIAALAEAFEPKGVDIVHTQDFITANAVEDCIRTVHHVGTFDEPQLAAFHERALTRPRTVVCVCSAVAGQVSAACGRTPTVIPNGVEAHRFARAAARGPVAIAAREAWRKRLGRYVLTVGGIEPRKGSIDLLHAMAALRRSMPEVQLAIAGGESVFDHRDYRAEWEQVVDELSLTPVVLGPVPHESLPGLVAAAGAFAFPSINEGFGAAGMEALAAGVPLVASDLPVMREVFGAAARFAATPAELAGQLAAALREPDPERRAAGEALVARHTWSAAADAHLRLYRQVRASAGRA